MCAKLTPQLARFRSLNFTLKLESEMRWTSRSLSKPPPNPNPPANPSQFRKKWGEEFRATRAVCSNLLSVEVERWDIRALIGDYFGGAAHRERLEEASLPGGRMCSGRFCCPTALSILCLICFLPLAGSLLRRKTFARHRDRLIGGGGHNCILTGNCQQKVGPT